MDYLKNHKIKPKEIDGKEVIFTDGTNDIRANQVTCEAYGYIWDENLGVCRGFQYSSEVQRAFTEDSTKKLGIRNNVQRSTKNSLLVGDRNKTKGENDNVFITGQQNEIDNKIKFIQNYIKKIENEFIEKLIKLMLKYNVELRYDL